MSHLPITRISHITNKVWLQTLGFGSLSIVALSLIIQSTFHLQPCPLCIAQRVLFIVIGILALALSFLNGSWRHKLIQVVSLAGFSIASYQTWLQKYPENASTCGGANPNLIEQIVDYLGSISPDLFLATGFCTDTSFTILGLTFANWGILMFLGIYIYLSKTE